MNRRGGGQGREGIFNSSAHLLNKYHCSFVICMGAWHGVRHASAATGTLGGTRSEGMLLYNLLERHWQQADRVGSHVYIIISCMYTGKRKMSRWKQTCMIKKKTLIVCKSVSTHCKAAQWAASGAFPPDSCSHVTFPHWLVCLNYPFLLDRGG